MTFCTQCVNSTPLRETDGIEKSTLAFFLKSFWFMLLTNLKCVLFWWISVEKRRNIEDGTWYGWVELVFQHGWDGLPHQPHRPKSGKYLFRVHFFLSNWKSKPLLSITCVDNTVLCSKTSCRLYLDKIVSYPGICSEKKNLHLIHRVTMDWNVLFRLWRKDWLEKSSSSCLALSFFFAAQKHQHWLSFPVLFVVCTRYQDDFPSVMRDACRLTSYCDKSVSNWCFVLFHTKVALETNDEHILTGHSTSAHAHSRPHTIGFERAHSPGTSFLAVHTQWDPPVGLTVLSQDWQCKQIKKRTKHIFTFFWPFWRAKNQDPVWLSCIIAGALPFQPQGEIKINQRRWNDAVWQNCWFWNGPWFTSCFSLISCLRFEQCESTNLRNVFCGHTRWILHKYQQYLLDMVQMEEMSLPLYFWGW